MWNLVTEQWIGTDQTSEWYNSIQEFTAIPRWIPKGFYSDKKNSISYKLSEALKLLIIEMARHGPSYSQWPLWIWSEL